VLPEAHTVPIYQALNEDKYLFFNVLMKSERSNAALLKKPVCTTVAMIVQSFHFFLYLAIFFCHSFFRDFCSGIDECKKEEWYQP
jgi:hypothetical protein